jgi:hypothetical protein
LGSPPLTLSGGIAMGAPLPVTAQQSVGSSFDGAMPSLPSGGFDSAGSLSTLGSEGGLSVSGSGVLPPEAFAQGRAAPLPTASLPLHARRRVTPPEMPAPPPLPSVFSPPLQDPAIAGAADSAQGDLVAESSYPTATLTTAQQAYSQGSNVTPPLPPQTASVTVTLTREDVAVFTALVDTLASAWGYGVFALLNNAVAAEEEAEVAAAAAEDAVDAVSNLASERMGHEGASAPRDGMLPPPFIGHHQRSQSQPYLYSGRRTSGPPGLPPHHSATHSSLGPIGGASHNRRVSIAATPRERQQQMEEAAKRHHASSSRSLNIPMSGSMHSITSGGADSYQSYSRVISARSHQGSHGDAGVSGGGAGAARNTQRRQALHVRRRSSRVLAREEMQVCL